MRAVLGGGRLAMAAPTWAQTPGGPTGAMDDAWHFDIAPYMWMTGIKGESPRRLNRTTTTGIFTAWK